MPEHIRALVVVLVLSSTAFYFARPALANLVSLETFKNWRTLWFFTILAWFLAHSFWVYSTLMLIALAYYRKKDSDLFALYLLLIFAAPPSEMAIPGFGIVDHIIRLSHYRLLALTLLLPVAIRLANTSGVPKIGSAPLDKAVLAFVIWISLLGFRETSVTNGFRIILLNTIDLFLPYYVASRSVRSLQGFKNAFAALIVGAILLSALAAVEVASGWRLYLAAANELGFYDYPRHYKMRGPFLRPAGTVIDSIMLGWVIVLSMGGLLFLSRQLTPFQKYLAWTVLIGGVIASMSRAPWVASILVVLIFFFQSGRALANTVRLFAVLLVMLLIASLSPYGDAIIKLLPFIGDSEQGSIEYRANWFSVVGPVIERNFLFGDILVLNAPELQVMRQGEGIIDLVNTFLSMTLYYGVIGLGLFVYLFYCSLLTVAVGKKKHKLTSADMKMLGSILIALVLVNMFMLITVSFFLIAPLLVFLILGLCSAYGIQSSGKDGAGPSAVHSAV